MISAIVLTGVCASTINISAGMTARIAQAAQG
jgi:hypothetical protein